MTRGKKKVCLQPRKDLADKCCHQESGRRIIVVKCLGAEARNRQMGVVVSMLLFLSFNSSSRGSLLPLSLKSNTLKRHQGMGLHYSKMR
jgi:hypothetical protein